MGMSDCNAILVFGMLIQGWKEKIGCKVDEYEDGPVRDAFDANLKEHQANYPGNLFWSSYDDSMEKILDETPYTLVRYAHYDCPMWALGFKHSMATAYSWDATYLSKDYLEVCTPSNEEIKDFVEFVRKNNLPVSSTGPNWILLADEG